MVHCALLFYGPEENKAPSVFPLQPCCGSLGTDVSIGCLASGYLPQTVEIKWNGGTIQEGIKNFSPVNINGRFTSSSQLTISGSDWKTKPYSCIVQHLNTTIEKQVPKCGAAHKASCPEVAIIAMPAENDKVNVTCFITGLKSKNGLEVKLDQKNNQQANYNSKSTLNWLDETRVTSNVLLESSQWTGNNFICSVKSEGCDKLVSKEVPVFTGKSRKPSQYLFKPHEKELKESPDSLVTLICLIKGHFPKDIYIQWKQSGQLIQEKYTILNTEPMLYNEGLYIMASTITVPSKKWELFSCHSYHWSGLRATYKDGPCVHSQVSRYDDDDDNDEGDDDSLWVMAATFITLFLLTTFYSATITLVKLKWFISRILEIDSHFMAET